MDEDVFLASYPRSGSSWLRFMIYEMVAGNATFDAFPQYVPEIHELRSARPATPSGGRVVKTHEGFRPEYRRAIHLVRDPRDVAVSYFRYMQRIQKIVIRAGDDEAASFDRFVSAMVAGRVDPFGTWQAHLLSWINAAAAQRSDVLRIRYEDLRADPATNVRRIAEFLQLSLSESDLTRVAERSTLDRMAEDERRTMETSTSAFALRGRRSGIGVVNTGRVEAWRERMTPEQVARFAEFTDGMSLMHYPLV